MRLAQIIDINGIETVHWIFEADAIPQYAPPCDRIFEVAPDVREGWLWNDGDPLPAPLPEPEPVVVDLDGMKRTKRLEMQLQRDAMIAAGFVHAGHKYPINSALQTDMLTQLMGMQLMPPPPGYIYEWKDADGIYREIGSTEAFQVFCAQALGYGESIFARERMLHGIIAAAGTLEEVKAISWDTVPNF